MNTLTVGRTSESPIEMNTNEVYGVNSSADCGATAFIEMTPNEVYGVVYN